MSNASRNPDTRPLPQGWITQYDKNYDTWFYVNTSANPPVTTWTHPAENFGPPSGPPPSQQQYQQGAPSGQQDRGFLGKLLGGSGRGSAPQQGYGGGYGGPPQGYGGGYGGPSYGGGGGYGGPPYGGGYGGPGYGPGPGYYPQQQYAQAPPKKSGLSGGTGLALGLGGGLLGGMLIEDMIDNSEQNSYDQGFDAGQQNDDYGGGGDF